MATKVKPTRLQVTGTPQAGDVPMYVDANTFQWWAWWWASFWRFLSLWDCSTWMPISFPEATPYTYITWDYFIVETVSSATPPVNYRPDWSTYTGTASSTTESDEVEVWDVYVYDGSVWLLQSNHWKTVSFNNIAGDAMDNASLSWYLNMKAFNLSSTSDLTTAQAAYNWQNWGKTAVIIYNNKPYVKYWGNAAAMDFWSMFYREQLDWNSKTTLVRDVVILSLSGDTVTSVSANSWNNIMASVIKTDTDYSTPYTPQYAWSPATKKYVDDKVTASASAPVSPTEWMLWYDTTNDALKVYDWSQWQTAWWWDVQVSTQANNILTSWTKLRAGTEANYQSLWTYDSQTIYLTIE